MFEGYDIFLKRGDALKLGNKEKMILDKRRDFETALGRSYNSETIEINGTTTKALISRYDSSPILRTKHFSSLQEHCSLGDVFRWVNDDSYWMIVEKNENEPAFFNGTIKKAPYLISWRNDINGVSYTTRGVVKGPEQTTLNEVTKSNLVADIGNLSLSILLPKKLDGIEHLKRYSKVFVNGEKWEVVAIDAYTEEDFITFDMIESPIDRDLDDKLNQIPNGGDEVVFTHSTILTDISQVNVGYLTMDLSPVLYRNSVIYNSPYVITTENCSLVGSAVSFDSQGVAEVIVTYPDLKKVFTYPITVVPSGAVSTRSFYIDGPSKVASYTSEKFSIYLKENGVLLPTTGTWSYDSKYFKLISISSTELVLEAMGGLGTTKISYSQDSLLAEMTISIVPIFEI